MSAILNGTYDVAKTDAVEERARTTTVIQTAYTSITAIMMILNPASTTWSCPAQRRTCEMLWCSSFDNVIVVINANNAMELDWVDKYDSIGAVILAPGTGAAGMTALGRIFNGTVNPSGRTVDTYLKDLTKAPTWNHFGNSGNHLFTDVEDLIKQIIRNDNTFQGVFSFVDYVENIYMGLQVL